MSFCLFAGMVYGQAMKVASDGNVAINNGTPLERLHVTGDAIIEAESGVLGLLKGGSDNGRRFSILNGGTDQSNSASYMTMNGINHNANFVFNGKSIAFLTNKAPGNFGSRSMDITAAGDVGIGTQTPGYKLEVIGTAGKTGGGEWAVSSDRRLKKNVNKYGKGLESVLSINPVTFEYNGKGNTKSTGDVFVGVVAQEFQKVDPSAVNPVLMKKTEEIVDYDEFGDAQLKTKILEQGEYLTVDASNIKYMLVNAVKEQQVIIDEQDSRIAKLEDMVQSLLALNLDNNSEITLENALVGSLSQNAPNPFNGATSINYVIPQDAKAAKINIYDMNGQLLRKETITHLGNGTLKVNADNIPSGTYTYNLVVDGKVIGTNKMILQN